MAGRHPYPSFLIIVLFLLLSVTFCDHVAEAYDTMALGPLGCKVKCKDRCKVTRHRKTCNYFCIKCCNKCHCVPSKSHICSCYINLKTKNGALKMPMKLDLS
ncbi:Gibberellin regulated protein [Quillaja saponaria]|uniref:Gibberellin regulated protein n=1 Tax=Quillaja saponaria TaxID=32244 RepID=A0AAD7LUK2_QUISA|nr:Gibberellin regulated protein [Quillaja saponaria]